MSFFSNIKNAITGGAAAVQLTAPAAAKRGDTIAVTISATAKGTGTVKGVYLVVRATESAHVQHTAMVNGQSRTETVSGSKITYETKIAIAPGFQLEEGKTYSWQGQAPIPPNTNASFKGQLAQHVWELQAGLDMTGNDPDSGWKPVEVG
jgi:hypothetical protein